MAKSVITLVMVIIFVSCLSVSYLSAQDNLKALKAQLNEVKQQAAQMTNAYKKNLADVRKDCNGKIDAAKNQFHNTRKQYLADLKAKEQKLKSDYDAKMLPLQAKVKDLVRKIEPLEPNNWVKR